MATRSGPAQLVLEASVARRYYIDGRSKLEIADELGLSRFKVARLLDAARASGLVRIEIGLPGEIDFGLSAELRSVLRLEHAVVVDSAEEDDAVLRDQVGAAAAELLSEIVGPGDVLGLGWSRALLATSRALTRLAPCPVVQLTGALSRPDVDASSIELVRDVARVGGGPAYFFYAPMILPDAVTAESLRGQPEVARALELIDTVTKALVGVGSWDPPFSTVWDAVSPAERAALNDAGVRADVSGVLLDADGREVPSPLAERMVCVRGDQLLAVPEVIGVAYGPEKAPAALAAVRGGYLQGLVTHTAFARALLAAA